MSECFKFYPTVAAVVLLTATGCSQLDDVCFECSATPTNGQGAATTQRICETTLAQSEMNAFRANFEAQHDTAVYDINCVMR